MNAPLIIASRSTRVRHLRGREARRRHRGGERLHQVQGEKKTVAIRAGKFAAREIIKPLCLCPPTFWNVFFITLREIRVKSAITS